MIWARPTLPRLVGSSLAAELILTGKFIGAERAMSLGLYRRWLNRANSNRRWRKICN